MKTKSTQAQVASTIKKHLKANGVKATAKSESFAGGNSVDIYITDQLPAVVKSIKEYAAQFMSGHFNGMEDIYENSNSRDDIPQAKYVTVNSCYSDELRQAAWDYVRATFAGFEDATDDANQAWNHYNQHVSGAELLNRTLSNDGAFWTSRKPRITLAA